MYVDGIFSFAHKSWKLDDIGTIFLLKCSQHFLKSQIKLIKKANFFNPFKMRSKPHVNLQFRNLIIMKQKPSDFEDFFCEVVID